jgi:hypothetical protein
MIEDLLHGWAELEKALPGYLEAETYANGTVEEVFADKAIRDALLATSDGYRFNLLKTAIGVRVDRCEIDMIKVADNERATERLTEIWDANEMAIHYPCLFRDTFTYGDAYVMVWPIEADEDEEGTADDDLVAGGVEFTTHGPKNVRVLYDPENHRRKAFAISRWALPKNAFGVVLHRADLLYRDRVEHWITKPAGNLAEADGWELYADDGDPIEGHDFGEIPVFHHRTGLPYGKPVHLAGYGAQNAINKELITMLTTTDSQGHAQRYQLLDPDATLDENNDDPQYVDDLDAGTVSPDGRTRGGAQATGMRSGPGTMQTFAGTKEVGQFDAADPKVFIDPTELFIRIMAQTTNTPLHYFDPSGDSPSGESLKVAEAPLVKDIEWLQVLQTSPLREEWLFALGLAGVGVKAIDVRWAPVQTAVGLDDWAVAKAKQDAGVPTDQTLMEAGYRPEMVAEWLDAGAEAATLAQRIALLGQIGTAVRDLSSGVALGVISEEAANSAVELVLAQVNASATADTA